MESTPVPPLPTGPPFRPSRVDLELPSPACAPSTALRVGIAVLAVCTTLLLTGIGFVVGLIWSFSSCFKQTCSDVDAAAVVLLPLVGLAVGGVVSFFLWRKRA